MQDLCADQCGKIRPFHPCSGADLAEFQDLIVEFPDIFSAFAESAVVVRTLTAKDIASGQQLDPGILRFEPLYDSGHVFGEFLAVPQTTEKPDAQSVVGAEDPQIRA